MDCVGGVLCDPRFCDPLVTPWFCPQGAIRRQLLTCILTLQIHFSFLETSVNRNIVCILILFKIKNNQIVKQTFFSGLRVLRWQLLFCIVFLFPSCLLKSQLSVRLFDDCFWMFCLSLAFSNFTMMVLELFCLDFKGLLEPVT